MSSKGLDIIRPPGVRAPGYSPSKLSGSYGKGGPTPPAPSYGGGGPTPPASFRHHIIKLSSLVKSIVRGVFYPPPPRVYGSALGLVQAYWVTQKLPQICTVILRIRIGKFT